MSGFALPKLRWLVLGALAAGGWAMTQDVPSKSPASSSARTASRSETAPRRDATAARPKAQVAPRADTAVMRPKANVEPNKARVPPKETSPKLATAQRPKAEPSRPTNGAARPKAAVAQQSRANTASRPPADINTASISKAPKPASRPQATSNPAKSTPQPSLNVLYTSTTAYLRKRPDMASPVLHKLSQGASVRVFARDGKWTLVSASGRKGWVHDDVLRPADPAAPRPKEALALPAKGANPG